MHGKRSLYGLAISLGFLLSACSGNGDSAPVGSAASTAEAVKLERVFAEQRFERPTVMLQAPGTSDSWYVAEKSGRILSFASDQTGAQPRVFADLTDRVEDGASEAGLLGMAFHPDFASNGYVYVSYTGLNDRDQLTSYISRYKQQDKTLDAGGEVKLLSLVQPYSNHNGGNIAFGPDGYLYIGFGDGGSGGDPQGNGQNPRTLFGAMLRIDVDSGAPYGIPADNPFADGAKGKPEIYAWGLRNPWRWSFDRKTGQLWLADVGQNSWEEVDIIEKGNNYGWNHREGRHCYDHGNCAGEGLVDPVFEYATAGGNCSVTGGYVYRGKALPELQGMYLFGDFCSGRIWRLRSQKSNAWQGEQLIDSNLQISSFAEANDGEVYVLDYGSGGIYQLRPAVP